jgi:hypothetical protein
MHLSLEPGRIGGSTVGRVEADHPKRTLSLLPCPPPLSLAQLLVHPVLAAGGELLIFTGTNMSHSWYVTQLLSVPLGVCSYVALVLGMNWAGVLVLLAWGQSIACLRACLGPGVDTWGRVAAGYWRVGCAAWG